MLRLMVKHGKRWVAGIRRYKTEQEALARIAELANVGIKARIVTEQELLN